MTLEQYLCFCDFSLQFSKPDHIRQQKDREEQISTPFRLPPSQSSDKHEQSTNHKARSTKH